MSQIYLHARSNGKLFNLAGPKAKTKYQEAIFKDLLLADDAAAVAHQQAELQSLMDHISQACKDSRLTISLKRTCVLEQDTPGPTALVITINDYKLGAIHQLTHLGLPSLTTSHLTQKSTRGLERLPQHLPNSQNECGQPLNRP